MAKLGLLVQRSTAPGAGRAADRALLARAVARGQGAVRVSTCDDDVVALGRWHLALSGTPDLVVERRLTGGRVVAAGRGFVRVSIVLPHRSALVSEDPLALAPEQVLNRAVRGLLGTFEAAGLPALYPGRDLVTVANRPIAVLGLEVDDEGGTLVEAVVAVERDQSVLPHFLDRVDPEGVVAAPMILPDQVTAMARELGWTPSLDELTAWLTIGFKTRLGVDLTDEPMPAVAGEDEAAFLEARVRGPELDCSARTATMLGVLDVHGARSADGKIATVVLAGDLLAPSGTVARLEAALRGGPTDAVALDALLKGALQPPHDFLLGVGPVRTVADTIARAFA